MKALMENMPIINTGWMCLSLTPPITPVGDATLQQRKKGR